MIFIILFLFLTGTGITTATTTREDPTLSSFNLAGIVSGAAIFCPAPESTTYPISTGPSLRQFPPPKQFPSSSTLR